MSQRARKALIAAGVAVWIALSVFAGVKLLTAERPLTAYGEVNEAEARELGERVAAAFTEGDARGFDEALDLAALARLVYGDTWMSAVERQTFVTVHELRASESPASSIGISMLRSFAEGTRVKLVNLRVVDGRWRAVLRITPAEGVNYLELVLARDPAGAPRIIDWYSYMIGELEHVRLREISEAAARTTASTALAKRLLRRLVGREDAPASPDPHGVDDLQRIRELMDAGKNEEALSLWRGLPDSVRTGRSGLVLRLLVARKMSESVHQEAIRDIEARFPADPSFALLMLDGHFLHHDWKGALARLDELEAVTGGDPFLATLRALPLLELGRGAEARSALTAAIGREDDLLQLWWTAVGVSLRLRDYAETARLLDQIASKFSMTFEDLTTAPDYEGFVRSKEYRDWRARRPELQPQAGSD